MTSFSHRILEDIRNGAIDPNNAIDIVKASAKYVRGDREAVVDIIASIAKGPDGISGTADDIPPKTLTTLKMLLEQSLVATLAQELYTKSRAWSCCR